MKKYISSHPQIQGGEPCIDGTRTPVAVILHLFKNGYNIKQIHGLYPWIGAKTLQGALSEVLDEGIHSIASQSHG